MPNIKQYESPVDSLRPTEIGIDAKLQVARRGGAFFNQAGEAARTVGEMEGRMAGSAIRDAGAVAVDYADHQQISHGAVAYAGLTDALTQKWNDTAKNADPNDPTVAAQFREKVLEPELEKFRDSFSTEKSQAWAESHVDALRNHMFQKTAADMSTLAGQAVAVNVQRTSNALSNTAMTDPSSVPHLLDTVESSVGAMVDTSPNLKGADAGKVRMALTEKMKEGIVKSGAIGAIQNAGDPEAVAKAWGEKYPEYISGDELKMLSANARQQIRAARTDAAYGDHLQKVAQQDRSDATETGYLTKLYSDDPKVQGQVSTKAIVNDPNLTRVAKERMINVVNRELKPETDAKKSNGNYVGILSDIRAGKISDVDPIYKAREDGKLNRADFNQALKDFSEYKSPQGEPLAKDRENFFKRYAPAIDPSMGDPQSMQFGHHTALGLQKMYDAEKGARQAEEDARKKGQDPHSVYDPSSPNFFGRPENIMKYRASLQDAQKYQGEISFTPPPTWEYSPSRKQYRDPATKKIYGPDGKAVQ